MLELKGVTKRYSKDVEIRLKDFKFKEGVSYCVLGPSGCGKSTMLNMLAGLVKPTEGDVFHLKNTYSQLTKNELSALRYNQIGVISQDFKLFDNFTVKDNLNIVGVQKPIDKDVSSILESLNLSDKLNKKVKTLSGGERQRVSIARALLRDYKIWLCDEPTASLNIELGVQVVKMLLKRQKETNGILIVVTHDTRLTEYFDEVISFDEMLKRG